LAARAQQPSMPVIGFLASPSCTFADFMLLGFRQGLKDNGYVEGESFAIESVGPRIKSINYRRWRPIWRRRVALIVAVPLKRRWLPR
jgi:hypothetical protein